MDGLFVPAHDARLQGAGGFQATGEKSAGDKAGEQAEQRAKHGQAVPPGRRLDDPGAKQRGKQRDDVGHGCRANQIAIAESDLDVITDAQRKISRNGKTAGFKAIGEGPDAFCAAGRGRSTATAAAGLQRFEPDLPGFDRHHPGRRGRLVDGGRSGAWWKILFVLGHYADDPVHYLPFHRSTRCLRAMRRGRMAENAAGS